MRRIGISVYPEQSTLDENLDYIRKASKMGFDILFLSILQFDKKEMQKHLNNYKKVIKEARKLNYYVILDVADVAFELMETSIDNLKPFYDLGVSCLRLDSPLLPAQVAMTTYNKYGIDIQINVSNNDSFINNIMDFKPIANRLSGSHNFYPLEDSGLPLEYFVEATKRFKSLNLKTMAFVGCENGNQGPVPGAKKLVSLESHRSLDIEVQTKHLFAMNLFDWVVIGNSFATDEELMAMSLLQKEYISIKIKSLPNGLSEVEHQILFQNLHFRRGDISESVVRSTMTRPKYKDESIPPKNIKKIYSRGDIVILNNNAKHYKGELQIILKDNYEDKEGKFNFVENMGKDLVLLNYIDAWTKFEFYK